MHLEINECLGKQIILMFCNVNNSAARLIRGLKRFDHISPVLNDLQHWLPYPQLVIYKVCMLMFKCLKGLAPAYVVAFCTKDSAVSDRSALRSSVCGDLVVPGHRKDWGLRAFAVASPSCWNGFPVELRDLSIGPETFAKHLQTHLFRVGFFWWSMHFWVCLTFCKVPYRVQS